MMMGGEWHWGYPLIPIVKCRRGEPPDYGSQDYWEAIGAPFFFALKMKKQPTGSIFKDFF